jgi:hypothetical protein
MSQPCHTCGNIYDKAFTVTIDGRSMTFDSFECAIHACAPRCASCGCTIVGHGVEQADEIYCGAHCAARVGAVDLVDRA